MDIDPDTLADKIAESTDYRFAARIQNIKLYRSITGFGLAASKEKIDAAFYRYNVEWRRHQEIRLDRPLPKDGPILLP